MADSDDGFVSRWSRRKREARRPAAPDPARARETPEPQGRAPGPAEAPAAPARRVALEDLPDIESLDETSDFTVFLQEGVPEALRRQALRKLWRLNPVFANLDGLNDYDQDFTDAATVVKGLKTLYQVGRGMVSDEPAPAEAVAASAQAGRPEAPPPAPGAPEAGAQSAAPAPASQEAAAAGEAEPQAGPEPGPGSAGPAPRSAGRPAARRGAAERRWGRFRS